MYAPETKCKNHHKSCIIMSEKDTIRVPDNQSHRSAIYRVAYYKVLYKQ